MSTRILVDADACPVKAEIERVATRHKIEAIMVANGGIRPSQNPFVSLVVVPEGPDVADQWIADRAGSEDVVVTADILLADAALKAKARVLRPDGSEFTARNIGSQVAARDLMNDVRAADPFHQGRGRSFSQADRQRFLNTLERLIRDIGKENAHG